MKHVRTPPQSRNILYLLGVCFALILLRLVMNPPNTAQPQTLEPSIISAFPTNGNAVIATPKPAVVSVPIKTTPRKNTMKVMAWIYPGAPTCTAQREFSDGRDIDVLKPEYFTLGDDGSLILLTETLRGCNGFSLAAVAAVKKYSKKQYVTISSSDATRMGIFLKAAAQTSTSIDTIVSFVIDNGFRGAEIDFEDFGGWSGDTYIEYKQFITALGSRLHQKNKKLMVDGPATADAVQEAWYIWRYQDFVTLPVDTIVVMTYDYQFDQGAGQPVAPLSWIRQTIAWTLSRYPDTNKLIIGVPSYGYTGILGTQQFTLLTYDEIKNEPGFASAHRDTASAEMTWTNGNTIYFYQDEQSLTEKRRVIEDAGIKTISVWHLGGNRWFTK